MTKAELIDQVHGSLEGRSKKETGEVVQAVFDALAGAIKADGRFSYPGFGTFNVKERGARAGRNPRTGDAITIPASKSVGFKAAPTFKDSL
ncbi:MAG: integration host factor [Deltaproteobacteria bacterium HGW-Deltaproteobacteria-14]|jgi:DNA-binding protein HU-beta|nr:MAG: integration host factor [Deltaproteobacteria bacterium HGW-Deltaproteobacteria-14]